MAKQPSRPTSDPSAFTLAEVTVASFVAVLLMMAAFFIYRTSVSVWMKGDSSTEVRNAAVVALQKVSRDLERSIYDSVSVSADQRGVVFLTALDDNGRFQYDPVNQWSLWQAYHVYYFDPPTRSLRLRRVPVVGTPQETVPTRIESFGPSQPVDTYLNSGQLVAPNLDAGQFGLEASFSGAPLVRMIFRSDKKRYGSERLESYGVNSVIHLRN